MSTLLNSLTSAGRSPIQFRPLFLYSVAYGAGNPNPTNVALLVECVGRQGWAHRHRHTYRIMLKYTSSVEGNIYCTQNSV